jgi:glycerol-3-phosphate cytidylyltransferase
MRKVITYGTFDLLHYGHILLLKRARALGDHLTVGLSTDEFNRMKGKSSFFTYEERKLILESIRYVDAIIPETCWEQKVRDVIEHHIDVFVIGNDWEGKFDFLKPFCEVIYLPRTENISSSQIREYYKENRL